MSNVTFQVQTRDDPLPAGKQDSGNFEYVLVSHPSEAVVNRFQSAQTTIEFPGIVPGLYTMSVQRVARDGSLLGTPVSVDFEVAQTTFPQPLSISVASIV